MRHRSAIEHAQRFLSRRGFTDNRVVQGADGEWTLYLRLWWLRYAAIHFDNGRKRGQLARIGQIAFLPIDLDPDLWVMKPGNSGLRQFVRRLTTPKEAP